MALFTNESLNHWFTRLIGSTWIHSETKHSTYYCMGNIFVGTLEQKQIILCQKTMLNSYLLNCWKKINITFALMLFRTKTALVWYCLTLSWYKYDTETHTGAFLPWYVDFKGHLTAFYRLYHTASCCPASCSSPINFMKMINIWGACKLS